MSNAYILYGKAGSGKGTQAELLKKHLESQGRTVIYIETGELFRTFAANNSSFAAKRTAEIVGSGQLMPPFFPISLWTNELVAKYTGTEDIILDGVGRRLEEAQILDSALDFFQVGKRFVFHVHVFDATSVERLTNRSENRVDDASIASIQKRLDWYKENVLPVFEMFREHPAYVFAEINGEESVEGVFAQIGETLSK